MYAGLVVAVFDLALSPTTSPSSSVMVVWIIIHIIIVNLKFWILNALEREKVKRSRLVTDSVFFSYFIFSRRKDRKAKKCCVSLVFLLLKF